MKDKGFLFKHDNWFDIRIEKGSNKDLTLEKAKEIHAKYWKKKKNIMKTIYKYYKNSNTGKVMKSCDIVGLPIAFYKLNGNLLGENLDTTGFVEISEKKWNRLKRKSK